MFQAAIHRGRPELLDAWFRTCNWKPNRWQRRVKRSRARHVGIFAGRRAGKTEYVARVAEAIAVAVESPEWTVGPTYPLADKVFGEVWTRLRRLGILAPGSKYHDGLILLPNGSRIERRSADSKGNVGDKNRLVVIDEACRMAQRVWAQDLRPTLSDLRGSAFWITSPNGFDWVHEECERWEKGEAPDWEWFEAPSWDNEYVFPGGRQDPEILAAEAEYRAAGLYELFEQEYGGKRRAMAGRVFRLWDPLTMVVDDHVAARGVVEWWLGIDWGWRNPTCVLLVGRTGDGNWRVLDEWYEPEKEDDEIWAAARAMLAEHRLGPKLLGSAFHDPEDPRLGSGLADAGFPAAKAHNDQADGKVAVGEAIGRPGGLLVARRCKHLPRELDTLVHRPATAAGASEIVAKINDHAYDALRYVLASVKKQEKTIVRPARVGWV